MHTQLSVRQRTYMPQLSMRERTWRVVVSLNIRLLLRGLTPPFARHAAAVETMSAVQHTEHLWKPSINEPGE